MTYKTDISFEISTESAINRSVFSLYIKYGFRPFPNFIKNEMSQIKKEDIVQLLKLPEIKRCAELTIQEYTKKIEELEGLLEESK